MAASSGFPRVSRRHGPVFLAASRTAADLSPGVEDFGEMTAQPVDVGGHHFADPARRWAVLLDTGNLVFADTDQLVAE